MESENIKEQVSKITALIPDIQARLQTNIRDIEAIGMLDEVIILLEMLSQEDQGVCNILDGLYDVKSYVLQRQ